MIAGSTADRMDSPATASDLVTLDKSNEDFALLEVTDLNGAVLASSRPGVALDAGRAGLVPDRRRWATGRDLAGAESASTSSG